MEEIYPPEFIPIHLEIVRTDELLPLKALNIMLNEMRSKLDMKLMKEFIGFLAQSEKATPIHGGKAEEKNAGGTLGGLQAQRR
ncbi:hypothetical protein J7M22_14300 [Candidatus Poribacteria bacterium]|nr:hypothetical protein [Candidatus Poribacteria bacterium]